MYRLFLLENACRLMESLVTLLTIHPFFREISEFGEFSQKEISVTFSRFTLHVTIDEIIFLQGTNFFWRLKRKEGKKKFEIDSLKNFKSKNQYTRNSWT